MKALCADLQAEYEELVSLCETLTPAQWAAGTSFYGWTVWDEIAHLCFFDEAALEAVGEPERFKEAAVLLGQRVASGEQMSDVARDHYAGLSGPALLTVWRAFSERLVAQLRQRDPRDRLPWYGPAMSSRSFATARLMETWAHGQDIWDVVGRTRSAVDRLQHIAHLGVTTLAWTFVNRGLPAPVVSPYVELSAPDGSQWRWGDASSPDWVKGPAMDFCLVVTQRRHWQDTHLQASSGAMQRWLTLAQCFAGPPADGPARRS